MDSSPKKLFRYFGRREHAIDFLKKGEIRIPSLFSFRAHPDESRRDKREGVIGVAHKDRYGNSFRINTNIGHNMLVLCFTTDLDEGLRKKFCAEACIEVGDVQKFATAVHAAIPEALSCHGGICQYSDISLVEREDQKSNLGDLMLGEDGSLCIATPPQFAYINQMVTHDLLYRKQVKYSNESEFRFVWTLGRTANPYEFVTSLEAAKCCRLV